MLLFLGTLAYGLLLKTAIDNIKQSVEFIKKQGSATEVASLPEQIKQPSWTF